MGLQRGDTKRDEERYKYFRWGDDGEMHLYEPGDPEDYGRARQRALEDAPLEVVTQEFDDADREGRRPPVPQCAHVDCDKRAPVELSKPGVRTLHYCVRHARRIRQYLSPHDR